MKCFHVHLAPKVFITPVEMLPDSGQQLDLSMNGGRVAGNPRQPHLKPFLLRSTHLHQLRSQQDGAPRCPGLGVREHRWRAIATVLGPALLRTGQPRDVGQSWLPGQAQLSEVRLVQGSARPNPGWELPVGS